MTPLVEVEIPNWLIDQRLSEVDFAKYQRAVALLQDIARGLITADEALRELGERRP